MTDFSGYKIVKSDALPPGTMLVSADIYEQLTETPEQRQDRLKKLSTQMDFVMDRFAELKKP